jgi:AraC-like DNA-binding protein
MRQAVSATSCDHFGLLLGATALSNPLGLLGEMLQHCSNVGTAIAYFQQFFHLHDQMGIATRSVDGQSGSIGYVLFHGNSAEADQVHDAAIAIGMSLMRAWAGPDWKPQAVTLPRRKPRNLQPYRKVFGIAPQFECEHPALHFDAHDFARPIAGADAIQFALLSEKIETVASGRDLAFSDQVRRTMRGLIALGRCSSDDLAAAFSMSRRHMNRRLATEGTNYRLLHEEAQYALAERMLLRTDKSLVEISVALNYSDATAFTRAFKRRNGCSPSAWRNLN